SGAADRWTRSPPGPAGFGALRCSVSRRMRRDRANGDVATRAASGSDHRVDRRAIFSVVTREEAVRALVACLVLLALGVNGAERSNGVLHHRVSGVSGEDFLFSGSSASSVVRRSPLPQPTPLPVTAPKRIISLIPAVTEMLFAIGAGPQVAAVSSFDRYPPEVSKL